MEIEEGHLEDNQVKTVSTPLNDLLLTGKFVMADLFDFELVGGADHLRYTSHDQNITWGGNLYQSILIARSQIREQVGIEVGQLTVNIGPRSTDLVLGIPFTQAVVRGMLDGARCLLLRAFAPNWSTPITGTMERFSGKVSEAEPSRFDVQLMIKNDLELLDAKLPRRLYGPGCIHTLFDTSCGKLKASYAVSGAAAGTPTVTSIPTGLSNPNGYFSLGTVTFTSGSNSGVTRSVKSYSGGTLVLAAPLPVAPAAGDTFTAYPGCDKQLTTCVSKFSNRVNFRGHPYIPKPETAY